MNTATQTVDNRPSWVHPTPDSLPKTGNVNATLPSINEVVKPAEITVEDKLTFWNYLNDIQLGSFDPTKLSKLNTWVLTGDGAWLVQKNDIGYFGVKKTSEAIIDTLPKNTIKQEAFVHLTHGKIPSSLLDQILSFFRAVMKEHQDSEAFLQIYWDKTESKYIIHVPSQRVSKASVRYDKTKDLDKLDPQRYIFVYECHSHNSMGAFWSGTDNADENDLRLFGVFGQLDKDIYQQKHRTFVGTEEIDLPLDLIFDVKEEVPRYKVYIESLKDYITVTQNDIQIDQTPRYHVKQDETKTFIVSKENIKKIVKPVATFPKEWLSSVEKPWGNTFKPEGTTSPLFKGSGSFKDSPYFPAAFKKTEEETEKGNGERERSKQGAHQYGDQYLEELVLELADQTNNFEDIGANSMFIEALETLGLFTALKNTLNAWSGEYPDEDKDLPPDDYDDGWGNAWDRSNWR